MARRVVIVGGGFTGLVAARELARAGDARITVLERGAQPGGLAAGFAVAGTSLEKAYHYLLRGDTELVALIHELGLGGSLSWHDGSIGIWLDGRLHPFGTALDVLRFPGCGPVDRLRLGLAVLYLQRLRDWRPLARVTAREWLLRACGPGGMRAVWEPLLRGKFDNHAGEVSMAWLWARVHTRANSRGRGREQLGYVAGGFGTVAEALVRELAAAGVEVRTGATVDAIGAGGRRELVVDGTTLPYDQCLFTGPSDAFARLLPAEAGLDAFRRQLTSVPYLGAICLVFTSSQALTPLHWVNIHDAGSPFLVLVSHTALVGTAAYGGRHAYYLGCYRPHDHAQFAQDEAALCAEWFGYLRRMFPHFDAAAVQERHLFRFRGAQHVVDRDYEARIPPFRTPLPGVYLANFSQVFPEDRGTNFAVRDGRRVARLMADDAAGGGSAA